MQNARDMAVLEQILQYIASKKKEGVYGCEVRVRYSVLKEIVVLVNESTIKCNEYLNALMKVEEIVRTQTKRVGEREERQV